MEIMILSPQTIKRRLSYPTDHPLSLGIEPFSEAKSALGMTYGLGPAGYDIRVGQIDRHEFNAGDRVGHKAQSWCVRPLDFILLSSLEHFKIPHDVVGYVRDKSTLARKGLALQNTVLEPGWEGYITLELSNHGPNNVTIKVGQPIAQVMFEMLDLPTDIPYIGKYQNQGPEPVKAIISEH